MRDYLNIVMKIKDSIWVITPDALDTVLSIVENRIQNGRLTDEEIKLAIDESTLVSPDREVGSTHNEPGIGVLHLHGPIFGRASMMTQMSGATSLEQFSADLDQMVNDPNIRAIVLEIDSPGGTLDMVVETGQKIFEAKATKPIYAIANSMAGSAAYWLASQATQVFTSPSGMVGSLGVYSVHEDRSGADAQAGKRFTYVSAGPFKTEGNPHEPLSPEGKQYTQKLINGVYDQFVEAVASGRGLDPDHVIEHFGGGRMLSAKDAVEVGAADDILSYGTLIRNLTRWGMPHPVGGWEPMAARKSIFKTASTTTLETKEWEHSEPGTGSPPQPRTDEDGSDDKAIVERYRRNETVYDDLSDPRAPKPNSSEGQMEAELRKLLGLGDDGDILAAVEGLQAEVTPLREAVAASNAEQAFAKQFPSIHKDYLQLMDANRQTLARDFISSVQKLTGPEGDGGFKELGYGLSALAMETLEINFIKFAMGNGKLADFEDSIKTIMHGGMVMYGEVGSSTPAEPTGIDVSSSLGIMNTRKVFAAKVTEIMEKDGLEYTAAIAQAGKLYPDLAAAYNVSGVGR